MKQATVLLLALVLPACHVLDKEIACDDFETSLQDLAASGSEFGFKPSPETAERYAAAARRTAATLDPIADDPAVQEFQAAMNESADRTLALGGARNDARKAVQIATTFGDPDFALRYNRSFAAVQQLCGR